MEIHRSRTSGPGGNERAHRALRSIRRTAASAGHSQPTSPRQGISAATHGAVPPRSRWRWRSKNMNNNHASRESAMLHNELEAGAWTQANHPHDVDPCTGRRTRACCASVHICRESAVGSDCRRTVRSVTRRGDDCECGGWVVPSNNKLWGNMREAKTEGPMEHTHLFPNRPLRIALILQSALSVSSCIPHPDRTSGAVCYASGHSGSIYPTTGNPQARAPGYGLQQAI
jgi:hypothetical protein